MNSLFNLTGKVVIVTGASSGIGVQFAKALAQEGADIAIVARRLEKLQVIKEEVEGMGRRCLAIKCDVTKEDEIKKAVEQTINKFGKIDILVNNAGVAANAPAEEMTEAQWDQVLDTDLKSLFLFSKNVAPHMIEQQYGKIINTSSMFGLVGNTAFPVCNYHAAKSGVIGLTKALAAEWAKHNITVNAIGPGFFESEMTEASIHTPQFEGYVKMSCPMQRVGKTGELNGALIYLASDASSYTTGQIIAVDGGWTAV